jgi:hypothetical protein
MGLLRRVIDMIQANGKGAESGPVLETAGRLGQADRGGISGAAEGGDQRRPRAGCDSWVSNATDVIQRETCRVVAMKRGGAAGVGTQRQPRPGASSHPTRSQPTRLNVKRIGRVPVFHEGKGTPPSGVAGAALAFPRSDTEIPAGKK